MTTVHVFPADKAGCGHYRMIWPAEMLRKMGHDVHVFMPGEQDRYRLTIVESNRGRTVTLNAGVADCDVMVIQRPLDWSWPQLIPQIQALGVRVVADLDDDIAAIRANHAVAHLAQPTVSPHQNHQHLIRALVKADAVTVSTPALAEHYGRRDTVTVIPNCVPDAFFKTKRPKNRVPVIGWTGSTATHPDDLRVLGSSVADVMRKHAAEWRVVGDGYGVRALMGVEPVVVPYVPLRRYPPEVARFDIGVVPLALHRFNQGKSWLKGLEMAACGVPFVASPTAPYQSLVEQGAGMLAERPKVWAAMLSRLLSDPDLRAEVADRGRGVARRWTFAEQAWRWEEAWLGDRK